MRVSKSARLKRKTKERARPPAVGLRKAERTRIVLSNTNALEIRGLESLSTIATNLDSTKKLEEGEDDFAQGFVGQMMAFDGPVLDQLREAKAFKTTQNWNLFRAPSTLMRAETADVASSMRYVKQSIAGTEEGGPATVQRLVVGEKHSGKSIHLLQAMALAYANKWVVINIPDCEIQDTIYGAQANDSQVKYTPTITRHMFQCQSQKTRPNKCTLSHNSHLSYCPGLPIPTQRSSRS